ncbi:hypothetical protein BKI52_08570 [marine bacterium AO1-C]|nr:hypothetical protein BKI52_08570 [marine bacterium AO1-C]
MNTFAKFKNQALSQSQKKSITGGRIYRCYVGSDKAGWTRQDIEAGNLADAVKIANSDYKGHGFCENSPWSLGNEY